MSTTVSNADTPNRWYYMSAYATAVKHGYRGTEEEWLQDVYGGAERADIKAEIATEMAETAAEKALDSEAYGAGTRGGEAVTEDDPAHHNNAMYYAQEAAGSAETAGDSAEAAAASEAAAKDYSDNIGTKSAGVVADWLNDNMQNPDSPPLDRSLQQALAAAPADLVGDVRSAFADEQNVIFSDVVGLDIGTLTAGGTVNPNTGANSSASYATRTGYLDFDYPVLIKFNFDLSVYNYDIFTYSSHSSSAAVDNPTNGAWSGKERIIVFPPAGTVPCFRIGVKRTDLQTMTTDLDDPTSDHSIIKNGIEIYRYTDAMLASPNVAADAKAAGMAIKNALAHTDEEIASTTGLSNIAWQADGRIATNTDPISFTPDANNNWAYVIADCSAGDVYTLSAKSTDSAYRVYCFCDNDGGVIESADANYNWTQHEITAPTGATKLVCNSENTVNFSLYKGTTINSRISDATDKKSRQVLPTLFGSGFSWQLKLSYLANGNKVTSDVAYGFATTDPVAVHPGNQLVNNSADTDDDNVPINFYIIEFDGETFLRRYAVAKNSIYKVPDGVDTIRIMYGFASSTGIRMRKDLLSKYFAVEFLTQAKQNSWETPAYVAYGASTTEGTVHRLYTEGMKISPYSYPDYISQSLGLRSYNRGYGTTGFLARNGGVSPNIMDAIYGDGDILSDASLVTIMFGYGNDRGVGLPIGLYDDYYPYDEDGYHPSGADGITTMLSLGATLMGCLNWCIKWISEHYPKVTLVIVFGSPSGNEDRVVTVGDNPDTSSGRPPYKLSFVDPYSDPGLLGPYVVPGTGAKGIAQIREELPKLQTALNIPVVDLYFGGCNINYYNTFAKDSDGKYAIFSTTNTSTDPTWRFNSHPNDAGYKMFSRYLAGQILALFSH